MEAVKWLIAATVCMTVFLIHGKRFQENPAYFKTLWVGQAFGRERHLDLDFLRILAVLLVISVHTMEYASARLTPHTAAWQILKSLSAAGLSCNLIYIMISGALLLNGKEERLSSFYFRRVTKIAIPLTAYYGFYLLVHGGISHFYPENIGNTVKLMLSGAPDGAPHFWLIYVILSLTLAAPFIRVMVKHLSDKMLTCLLVFLMLFHVAETYLPIFQLSLGVEMMLASWETVFILGYFLYQKPSRRCLCGIMAAGAVSIVITVFTIAWYPEYQSVLYNTAPTMIMISGAIFTGGIYCCRRLKKLPLVFRAINRYSYSIILIHWFVLYYIVNDRMHINGLSFHIIGGCLLTIICTLSISYLFAFLFDNTIVLFCEILFHGFVSIFKKQSGN